MSILITGGTGFIGSRLALALLGSGESVRILGQANHAAEAENAQSVRAQGGRVILGSVIDNHTIDEAVGGVHTVYHLAAAQHEANVPNAHFYRVNVDGTQRMLEASVRSGVRRFVYGSTIGVYRSGKGLVTCDDSPTIPDNIYGKTKLEAEKVIASYQDQLPAVVVRITETYGPGDRRLLKLFRAVKKKRYFHIGRSDNPHHPIFIDDLIEALKLAAAAQDAPGQTLVVPGYEVVTTRQMVQAIAMAVGVDFPRVRVPMWPFWFGAVIMENTLGRLGIQPPLHRRRMHFFVKGFKFSGGPAMSVMGFQPQTPFVDGIKATAQWYTTEGLL